jgi:hypothetical protein
MTGALGGCKSSPAPAANGSSSGSFADDGTSGGGTSGSPTPTPPPVTTPSSTTPPIVDSGPPDTGPPPAVSNKDKITCGTATCDVTAATSNVCCSAETNPAQGTCGNQDGCPDFEAQCDEAADCDTGNVCCFGFGKFFCTDTGSCADEGQNIRICKTDAECAGDPNGTTCAPRTCTNGTKKTPVRMCGQTDSCK